MQRLLLMLACAAWSTMAFAAEEGGHGETRALINWPPDELDISTTVWVIIVFVLLLVVLYPTAWKGILAGLKAREERIRKDIADAEATRAKAQETLAEYNKQLAAAEERVRGMLVKAQGDGERLAATIRDGATKEAEAIKTKALADIEEAGRNAVAEVHAQTAELATAIAEKIIRRNLNVDDQRELVQASLKELETTRR